MLHLFYILFAVEVIIAIVAYTNVVEYPFMPVKGRNTSYLSEMRLNIYLCLSLLAIFFFHAFKNPQTLDDIPYYVDAFYESRNVSWGRVIDMGYETFKTETGFALVIKTISSLFSFDQILFVLTSAFILFAVYHSIKQYSPIFWVSVFVFLTDSFPQSLFVLRAFVAISIYLLAFPFIINRKIVPFLFLSALAFSMHMSSILFLPVYFLYGIKDWRYLALVLIVLGAGVIIGFNVFLPIIIESLFSEYAYYIINADNYEGASWKMPALLSAILLFRITVMREHFFEDGINRLLSIVMILAVVVYVGGIGFGLTSRMAMYFTNMTFLIFPNTIQYIKSPSWQFTCAMVYILFNSFFFFSSASDILWADYQLIEI